MLVRQQQTTHTLVYSTYLVVTLWIVYHCFTNIILILGGAFHLVNGLYPSYIWNIPPMGLYEGFLKCGYPNSWMKIGMENPLFSWIRVGGTPIVGNPHIFKT